MKILLINCPIRLNAKPNNIPYGLATIAAVLRQDGFEVEIYDVNAHRPSRDQVRNALKQKEWDMAGVSGLVTTIAYQEWLIPLLKEINSKAPVISGGGLATSNPELLFKNTSVDFIVTGEGELTMLELVRSFRNGEPAENIPGVCHRHGSGSACGPPRTNIPVLDTLPFPAWDLLPMDIYLGNPIWGDIAANSSGFRQDVTVNRSMNIISSRGCPFSCKYCYHLFGQSSYRFRSAGNIAAEIEALVDCYGVDFIGFVDDNMMASTRNLLEFCDLMEARRFPVTWGCHGRVSSAKPDILKRMAETGCVWIGYGIESGSQKILDAMNKKTTVERARQAVIDTRAAGIFPNTTFIFGYPGESRKTVQQTVDFKRSLDIQCGSFFATPYPGTQLWEEVQHLIPDQEAFIRSLDNATDFRINLTGFSDEELFALKTAQDANENVEEQTC